MTMTASLNNAGLNKWVIRHTLYLGVRCNADYVHKSSYHCQFMSCPLKPGFGGIVHTFKCEPNRHNDHDSNSDNVDFLPFFSLNLIPTCCHGYQECLSRKKHQIVFKFHLCFICIYDLTWWGTCQTSFLSSKFCAREGFNMFHLFKNDYSNPVSYWPSAYYTGMINFQLCKNEQWLGPFGSRISPNSFQSVETHGGSMRPNIRLLRQ